MASHGVTSKCPKCGSPRIHPSHVRSWLERARRAFTEKQPYRCHKCNFRAWYPIDVPIRHGPDERPADLRTDTTARPVTADDLDRLDKR